MKPLSQIERIPFKFSRNLFSGSNKTILWLFEVLDPLSSIWSLIRPPIFLIKEITDMEKKQHSNTLVQTAL